MFSLGTTTRKLKIYRKKALIFVAIQYLVAEKITTHKSLQYTCVSVILKVIHFEREIYL